MHLWQRMRFVLKEFFVDITDARKKRRMMNKLSKTLLILDTFSNRNELFSRKNLAWLDAQILKI